MRTRIKNFLTVLCLTLALSGCQDLSYMLGGIEDSFEGSLDLFSEPEEAEIIDETYEEEMLNREMQKFADMRQGKTEIKYYDVEEAEEKGIIRKMPTPGVFAYKYIEELRKSFYNLKHKSNQRKKQFEKAQHKARKNISDYFDKTAKIKSRLQSGTVSKDYKLRNIWKKAKGNLDDVNLATMEMATMAKTMTPSLTLTSFLLDRIRELYTSSTATEDDKHTLVRLEQDAIKTLEALNHTISEVNNFVVSRDATLNAEQGHLARLNIAIENGWFNHPSIIDRVPAGMNGGQNKTYNDKRPLIVIRFENGKKTSYAKALDKAINTALKNAPDLKLDLITVTENRGSEEGIKHKEDAGKKNAEDIIRTLSQIGIPLNRLTLSATKSTYVHGNEVQIYTK
ncbi:MAG: hypothetical protein ACTSXQ_04210 [Alphaproteobacteria bacterium]